MKRKKPGTYHSRSRSSTLKGNTHTEIFGPSAIATPGKYGVAMRPEEVVNIALDSYKNRDTIVITGDHNIEEVQEWRQVAYNKPGRYFSKDFTKSGLKNTL